MASADTGEFSEDDTISLALPVGISAATSSSDWFSKDVVTASKLAEIVDTSYTALLVPGMRFACPICGLKDLTNITHLKFPNAECDIDLLLRANQGYAVLHKMQLTEWEKEKKVVEATGQTFSEPYPTKVQLTLAVWAMMKEAGLREHLPNFREEGTNFLPDMPFTTKEKNGTPSKKQKVGWDGKVEKVKTIHDFYKDVIKVPEMVKLANPLPPYVCIDVVEAPNNTFKDQIVAEQTYFAAHKVETRREAIIQRRMEPLEAQLKTSRDLLKVIADNLNDFFEKLFDEEVPLDTKRLAFFFLRTIQKEHFNAIRIPDRCKLSETENAEFYKDFPDLK